MVKLVVERLGLHWAFAIEHCQGAEGARLVDIGAIPVGCAFGDEPLALPQKFGGVAIDGFFNAATKGVVFVGRGTAARQADADQSVLAVVAVFGDKLLTGAASLADLVAVGVVVVVPVALHEQAVAFDVGQVGDGQVVLGEQVAGRVMGEAFRRAAAHADQAIQRVVVEAAVAFSTVVDACQIAICVVRVVAVEQVAVLLADTVGLKAALVIVLILAEQQTLLALLLAPSDELVRGQARAVEVNAAKLAAALVVVIEFAAVRQAAMAQLAKRVVLVTRGAPALMLGNQAILQVVFVSERPVTVVDADQAA